MHRSGRQFGGGWGRGKGRIKVYQFFACKKVTNLCEIEGKGP